MQLTKMFLGIILTMVVVFGFTIVLGDGVAKYSDNMIDSYSNSSFIKIQNKYSELELLSQNMSRQLNNTIAKEDSTDFLGFFFNSGYKALQTGVKGVEVTYTVIDVSIDEVVPYEIGGILKGALILSVLIVIFIGIVLYSIIKGDRI